MKNTAQKTRKKPNGRENRELTLMTLPAVVWYILFCYLPLFGIAFAFKQFTPVPGDSLFRNLFVNSSWVGLKNFSFLLRSSQMPQILFANDPDFVMGNRFVLAALQRGVYMHPWHNMFLSAAHTEADIDRVLQATDGALKAVAEQTS